MLNIRTICDIQTLHVTMSQMIQNINLINLFSFLLNFLLDRYQTQVYKHPWLDHQS